MSSQSQALLSKSHHANAQYHHGVAGGGVGGAQSLSAANLPQSSNIVTGGKMIAGSASGGGGMGQRNMSGQSQTMQIPPGRKKWDKPSDIRQYKQWKLWIKS